MKILILILSAFLIFSYGCGGGDGDDSTETETQAGGTDPNNNDDDDDNATPSPRVPPIPIGPASPTPGAQDPCARYTASCGSDLKLCSDKYVNCLKPKAGEPATKETVTCKKQGSKDIVMVVNEWNHQPGTNSLLCEFFEDNLLYVYATNTKSSCKNELNRRKQELSNSGYTCN